MDSRWISETDSEFKVNLRWICKTDSVFIVKRDARSDIIVISRKKVDSRWIRETDGEFAKKMMNSYEIREEDVEFILISERIHSGSAKKIVDSR